VDSPALLRKRLDQLERHRAYVEALSPNTLLIPT
jgi:hypothetical protein